MWYALLDLTGIQKAVFETTRLKIVVGASLQIAGWQNTCEQIASDADAAWTSSAGGNVLTAFKGDTNKGAMDFVEKACSMSNGLGLNVAWSVQQGDDDVSVWHDLQHDVALFKAGARPKDAYKWLAIHEETAPVKGKERCPECGTRMCGGEKFRKKTVCDTCAKRGNLADNFWNEAATRAKYQNTTFGIVCDLFEEALPDNFDKLAGAGDLQSDALPVAVVVFDLNDMGNYFKDAIKPNNSGENFKEYKDKSKELEKNIREIYTNAINEVIPKEKKLAIYPVLLAGDDACFVLPQKHWPAFVQAVFKQIKEKGYTACAGVVIGAHNYPFRQLVNMAEELLANAKQKYRLKRKYNPGLKECVVDWHVFQESNVSSALESRNRIFARIDTNNNRLSLATAKPYTETEFETCLKNGDALYLKDSQGNPIISNRKIYALYQSLLQGPEATRDTVKYVFLREDDKHDAQLEKFKPLWELIRDHHQEAIKNNTLGVRYSPSWDVIIEFIDGNDWTISTTALADIIELYHQTHAEEGADS